MVQYIDKSALVAEIENLVSTYKKCPTRNSYEDGLKDGRLIGYKDALDKINILEVVNPYEQWIQYASIEAGIKAHAEEYSFNIESELFNQLTKEQQALWRKEIEEAVISGGYNGLTLAKDPRYEENHEVKEVDLEKESLKWVEEHQGADGVFSCIDFAKHFFELGMQVSNKAQKGE